MKTVNKDRVCDEFIQSVDEINNYLDRCKTLFTGEKQFLSYSYENAIIMLYKAFENFTLRVMISCLNHDHSFYEKHHSIRLGKHINDDVCEFLVTKGGFFDFKGRDGLCKVLNDTIGKEHNLAKVFKKNDYKSAIEQLCASRNFAAHNSTQSKMSAAKAFGLQRIATAGSCLKKNGRFDTISNELINLANEIKATPMG